MSYGSKRLGGGAKGWGQKAGRQKTRGQKTRGQKTRGQKSTHRFEDSNPAVVFVLAQEDVLGNRCIYTFISSPIPDLLFNAERLWLWLPTRCHMY